MVDGGRVSIDCFTYLWNFCKIYTAPTCYTAVLLKREEMFLYDVVSAGWGNAAHILTYILDVLSPRFLNFLIFKFDYVPWPTQSPNLSMCDFFMGLLKKATFLRDLRSLDELKNSPRVCPNQ